MTTESDDTRERPTSDPLFGKGNLIALFAWGLIVLAFSVGGLADVTRFWWLVLLFGAAAPVALVAVRGWVSNRPAAVDAGRAERELLAALREHGELTPTAAAMVTPLPASEAAKTLEKLAREGHLEAKVRDGAIAYALREGDRLALSGLPQQTTDEDILAETTPSEPLSGRELAVLKLLAAGRTNKDIARELFIAQGTVKAHVASVYRKLGVHSRAEAVSRAKDLGLFE
jgi:DNA-binding CsgD family transcriptional regulator